MEPAFILSICEFLLSLVADWYTVVFTGIIALFFFPVVILILFYAVAVFLYAYKSRRRVSYNKSRGGAWSEHFWNSARLSVSTFIGLLARYWHAHEVVGLENVPDKGPALLCIYHGTLPIDVYYILAKFQLVKKRRLKIVVDHFLFRLPGLKNLLDVFGCFTGPATECVKTLRNGHLLAIMPGGVREAIFSNDNYQLKWNNRQGFAKVALAARVPIIPVFTTNCRESFKVVRCVQGIFQRIYEKTKIPLVLYYGGFPVKMTTYFGPKIEYDPNMTPQQVSTLCANAIENMIKEKQTTPGTIFSGLKERWLIPKEKKT